MAATSPRRPRGLDDVDAGDEAGRSSPGPTRCSPRRHQGGRLPGPRARVHRRSSPSTATTSDDAMHSIANLALLHGGDNSALSNSVFEVKRAEILELRPAGLLHPGLHAQRVPEVLHGCRRAADPLLEHQDREHYLDAMTNGAGATTCSTTRRCRIVKGYLTSYAGLFERAVERRAAHRPDRDPAHPARLRPGRRTPAVEEIRTNFLEVLLGAIAGGEPVGLDFVYGKVDERDASSARRPAAADHAVPAPLVPRLAGRST